MAYKFSKKLYALMHPGMKDTEWRGSGSRQACEWPSPTNNSNASRPNRSSSSSWWACLQGARPSCARKSCATSTGEPTASSGVHLVTPDDVLSSALHQDASLLKLELPSTPFRTLLICSCEVSSKLGKIITDIYLHFALT